MMLSTIQIARSLGGTVTGRFSVAVPGPGHSPRDRSLSIKLDPTAPDGFRCHSFAGDDWRVCRAYVAAALGLSQWHPSPSTKPAQAQSTTADESSNKDRAREIWHQAGDPSGTVVEEYLAGRGLSLPPSLARRVIRFHPRLFHKETVRFLPAMVSLFRDIRNDEPRAIQRTWIENGKKFDRKSFGRCDAAAIKLTRDSDVMHGLTVAEGFESALAGYHLGFRPTWALGSASQIAKFGPLPGIEAISVLAEKNDGGANAQAINACAALWHAAGQEVFRMDPLRGDDANDAWQGAA